MAKLSKLNIPFQSDNVKRKLHSPSYAVFKLHVLEFLLQSSLLLLPYYFNAFAIALAYSSANAVILSG